jgi:hypothetical protein
MRLLVLAALLITARTSYGQNGRWTPLEPPGGDLNVQADFSSAQVSADDVVVVWVRMEFKSDLPSEVFDDDGSRQTVQYQKELARFIIDCRHRQYNFLQTTSYDARGNVVQSFTPDSAVVRAKGWNEPAPESLVGGVVRGVCNRETPAPSRPSTSAQQP